MTQRATTWDGKPISDEPPFGASIVVYRYGEHGFEFLVLHRAHAGPDYEGDWAWTPPAGGRLPGEPVLECGKRELLEEVGLSLELVETAHGSADWVVYTAMMDPEAKIRLDVEHDRYEWLPASAAIERCRPALVGEALKGVAD